MATAGGVLLLLAFAGTMAAQAKRIAAERDLVERAKADLESVVEFQAGMLSDIDTEALGRRLMEDLKRRFGEVARGRGLSEEEAQAVVTYFSDAGRGVNSTDVALRLIDEEILARAVDTLEETFADKPLIDAQLRNTIGVTYQNLGLHQAAEPQLRSALTTRKTVLGEDHPDTLRSMDDLAELYRLQRNHDKTEALHFESLEIRKRVLGDDHPETLDTMNNLARSYYEQGRYVEAEPLYLETLRARKRVLGVDHRQTLSTMNRLANLYIRQDRREEAEALHRATLEGYKRLHGADDETTIRYMHQLTLIYEDQDLYDEAEATFRERLEKLRRVFGEDHPRTRYMMTRLASLCRKQNRYDEAERLYREVLETCRRVLGDDHPGTLDAMMNLANSYNSHDKYAEARPLVAGWLASQKERAAISADPETSNDYAWMALTCEPSDLQEPESALRFALEANEMTGFGSSRYLDTLALAYHRNGDTARAIGTLEKAISLLPEAADRSEYETRLAEYDATLQGKSE
jgi:tetratricopeptide (TPR) repeat protein